MFGKPAQTRQAEIARKLSQCPLFADRPESDLQTLASISVIKSLAKGEYLFYEGSPVHGFYIVQQGAIKLSRVNLMGKEQVIHIFRPLASFAEETLFSGFGHPADACAIEPTEVWLVRKAEFITLLKRQPELALRVLKSLSQHFLDLVGLLDDLTLKDVKTRLVSWLLQHCPNPESYEPQNIQLHMTKRMLASELGTCSETFSRTLAKFREQALLAVEGKTLVLLCPIKLAQMLRPGFRMDPTPAASPFWNASAWRRETAGAALSRIR